MRGNRGKLGAALAAAAFLAACSGLGTKVSGEQARSFTVGKATYAEIVAALGKPTSETTSSEGDRVAVYSYVVKGAMVDSYSRTWTETKFTFDLQNVLKGTSVDEFQTGEVTPPPVK